MSQVLTVAMPKGRIFEEAVGLLRQAGYGLPSAFEESRKLIIPAEEAGLRFILAKPMDVATYVEYGVADVGICGKDVMLEESRDVVELLDLGISECHLAVAGLPDAAVRDDIAPKVASKYPNVAANYFREQGEQVDVIQLNGSIELAPLVGLAERIVDIVSTGATLTENGLVELAHITTVTSRLIANPVTYRTKSATVDEMAGRLGDVVT